MITDSLGILPPHCWQATQHLDECRQFCHHCVFKFLAGPGQGCGQRCSPQSALYPGYLAPHPGFLAPHPGFLAPHPGFLAPHPGFRAPHPGCLAPHHLSPHAGFLAAFLLPIPAFLLPTLASLLPILNFLLPILVDKVHTALKIASKEAQADTIYANS